MSKRIVPELNQLPEGELPVCCAYVRVSNDSHETGSHETQSESVTRVLDARYGAGNYQVEWFPDDIRRV
jgi:hypothetical protein